MSRSKFTPKGIFSSVPKQKLADTEAKRSMPGFGLFQGWKRMISVILEIPFRFTPIFSSVLKYPSSSNHSHLCESFIVASSFASTVASQLEYLASNLPLPVQSLIRNVTAGTLLKSAAQPASSSPTIDKIYSVLTTYSTVSYTTLCATLLAIVFAIYKYSMSYYHHNSFDAGWGGRRSPYTATTSGRANIADHVEYLTSDSLLSEPRSVYHGSHRYSVPTTRAYPANPVEDGPDTLLLRHKNYTHELHFQPFVINEGVLLVSDVRKYAAEKLGVADMRKLRLLYKGKTLRDDHLPAKSYGLKQHSEIMCVVSEAEAINGEASEHSLSDDNGSVTSNTKPRRQRANSTHRPARTQYHEQPQPQSYYQASSQSYHQPNISRQTTRTSNENLRAPAMEKQSSKQSNASHNSPPRARSPNLTASQNHSRVSVNLPIDPNTPLGKVNALSSAFHTQWLPRCTQFYLSPPSDSKARDTEYAKLSESVLAQVMLKADNIEMDGDTEARASRKQLVNEASEVLKKLDAVMKGQH